MALKALSTAARESGYGPSPTRSLSFTRGPRESFLQHHGGVDNVTGNMGGNVLSP